MKDVLFIKTREWKGYYVVGKLSTHELYWFPKRFIECTEYKEAAIKVAKWEKESFWRLTTFVVADELVSFLKVKTEE